MAPTWWSFDTLGGVHMLFSLPCHLTEPGCRLSGEALQGSGRCFHLLHDPACQITTICYQGHNVLLIYYPSLSPFIFSLYRHTCEHCFTTSSLNLRNPSWTLGSFSGNDRKCVKGCFFRKLSTRTSTRVTADETAAFWEPVTTVGQRKKDERQSFCFRECSLNLFYDALSINPRLSVLPLLVLGCW